MTRTAEVGLRVALIKTCQDMAKSGLSLGTSGNASVRLDDETILITPTGMGYEQLQPEDIVALKFDGKFYGRHAPSSEWRFHRDILKNRPESNAVVHCHSRYATALACQCEGIPAFHYMVAVAGGQDIRCADYATFGTQALSENVLAAMQNRQACLMANHGQIALGSDLSSALKLAGEVENLAAMYGLSAHGTGPHLLSDAEMATVIEKFKTYGSDDCVDPELTRVGESLPD